MGCKIASFLVYSKWNFWSLLAQATSTKTLMRTNLRVTLLTFSAGLSEICYDFVGLTDCRHFCPRVGLEAAAFDSCDACKGLPKIFGTCARQLSAVTSIVCFADMSFWFMRW